MMIDQPLDRELMREALSLAKDAMKLGEAPIASVVARRTGQIIGWGWNELNAKRDRTAHAEMAAFRDAAGRYPIDCTDLILVCTLEPCVMCLGAAMLSGVDRVVHAMRAPADGGAGRIKPPTSPESQNPKIVGGVMAAEARALFLEWLEQHPADDSQHKYIQQLLELKDAEHG
ncbi:MAG: nucleoside deaminase [Burkholderiales bacterium]|nr:nucleoside deaminase [Phycisphaerae bacterium]